MTWKKWIMNCLRNAGTLALALVLLISAPCTAPTLADDTGYVLTQRSEIFGDQYVYVNSNGLMCKNPRLGAAFVTRGPDWICYIYNEKTRVYYQTTLSKYRAELAARGISADLQGTNWMTGGQSPICGVQCTEYKMNGWNTLRNGKHNSTTVTDAAYWVSNEISIPIELGQLFNAMYGLPTTHRFPLRLTCTEKGAPKTFLDTYRVQRAPIPISYFAPPSGLTPVRSDAEVYMSGEQREIFNDMARDFDGGIGGTTTGLRATRTAGGTAYPGETINVGGVNLDKAKVQKFIQGLKNGK